MTGKVTWPEFRTLDEVRCFNCHEAPDLSTAKADGMPAGHGEHKAFCPACELWTWFDLRDRR